MIKTALILLLLVCVEINAALRYRNKDWFEWSFGHCISSQKYGRQPQEYIERCCVAPGVYTLACTSQKGLGLEGNIQIFGHKYCDEYGGYTAMEKIEILGM